MPAKQLTFSIKIFLLLITSTILTGCGGGGDKPATVAPISESRGYKLVELEFIDDELRTYHPGLFFRQSETQYESRLQALTTDSETLSDTAFRLEMAKFIANIGDQHTYISMPIHSMRKFPVKIWWDNDRAIVVETDLQHQALLGLELLRIDGNQVLPMRDIAMQYLAYQNEYWKTALSPRFMHLADVLEHEGLIASSAVAAFEFVTPDGEILSFDINSRENIEDWVKIEHTQEDRPLYSSNDENYWLQLQDQLLYVQYNSAFDQAGYPLTRFANDIREILETEEVDKIIVDLRFNYGGIIDHFVPVIELLAASQFNTPDTLYVLTGRHSFSSAVGAIYSFEALTEATFVGGPTGGKPNGYSKVVGYRLPGSDNAMYMSTAYLQISDIETDSFYPDYMATFSQQDFVQGRDPALVLINQM